MANTSQEAQEPSAEETVQPFSLISLIRTAQGQNGVKHGDYARYRRHCKNKLKALYKALKFQHGRTKYQKRKVDVSTVTDVRFLYIPLFNAERAWAYAQQFKKQMEGSVDLKARRHLIARMNKAASWAKELAHLASQRCDARGCLEAQAYVAYLSGSAAAERESDWPKALALLTRARHILAQLSKLGGTAESQALYLQQIEEIEPVIRFCTYQITRQGHPEPSEAQLLTQAEKAEGNLSAQDLKQQLALVAVEASSQAPETAKAPVTAATTTLTWMGQTVSIRQEKLRQVVQHAQLLESQIASCMDSESSAGEGASDPRVPLYEKLGRTLTEALTVAELAIKASTASQQDASYADLEGARAALMGLRATRQVELAEIEVSASKRRFAAACEKLAGQLVKKGSKERRSDYRAEEVVRHLDTLSRYLAELGDIAVRSGGQAGEKMYDETTTKSACARVARAYYTSHYLLASGRTAEAYALFGHVSSMAASAQSEGVSETDKQALGELTAAAAKYQVVASAERAAASAQEREGVESSVGTLNMADADSKGDTQTRFLSDALDSWESFVGGKQSRLYQLPFPMQAVPCRPIMVDTAAASLTYPSLKHRMKQQQQDKSVLSSLGLGGWGLGWGAKK